MSLSLYRPIHTGQDPVVPFSSHSAVKANASIDLNVANLSKGNGWNAAPVGQVPPIRRSKVAPNRSVDGSHLSKQRVTTVAGKSAQRLQRATAHPQPAAELELSSRHPANQSAPTNRTARSGQTTRPPHDRGTSVQSDALLAAHGVPRSLSPEQTRLANAVNLRMSLGPRDASQPGGDARWRELLADTGYLDDSGGLTKPAQSRLKQARQQLATDLQLDADEITRDAAAAYVAREHWTARAGADPAALARAQAAQEAENRLLQPQRQAYAQWQDTQRQYRDTVALIRGLRPEFDEAVISRAQVGESTLGQLAANTTPTDPTVAALRLNVAKQLLEHFESAPQASNEALQAQINAFKQDVGGEQVARWKQQLLGSGTSLDELLRAQAPRESLNTESVERLVAEHAPLIRPQRALADLLLKQQIQLDRYYQLRESTPENLAIVLDAALRVHPGAMMQISTSDGTGHWQIYRHSGQGSTVIDANTNAPLPLPTDRPYIASIKHTILQALQQTHGDEPAPSLVVSYSNHQERDSPVLRIKQNPGFWTKQAVNEFMNAWSANPETLRAALQNPNSALRQRFSNITTAEVEALHEAIKALPPTDPRKGILMQRVVQANNPAESQPRGIAEFLRDPDARSIAARLIDAVASTDPIGGIERARAIDLILQAATERGAPAEQRLLREALLRQLKIPSQLTAQGNLIGFDALVTRQAVSTLQERRNAIDLNPESAIDAINSAYMLLGKEQNELDSLADPDGARMRAHIQELNESRTGNAKSRAYQATNLLRNLDDQIRTAWTDNVAYSQAYHQRPDFLETVQLLRQYADDPSTLMGKVRAKPALANQYGELENARLFSNEYLATLQDKAATLDLLKRVEQHPEQAAALLAQIESRLEQLQPFLMALPEGTGPVSLAQLEEAAALQRYQAALRSQLPPR